MALVPGFYNETLNASLAARARPAAYVDVNCDLYSSSSQALRWLFAHRLVRPHTLLMYDDWFNTPFGDGESRVHLEVSREFNVTFELLHRCSGRDLRNNLVLFRVASVGERADDGVPPSLTRYKVWN